MARPTSAIRTKMATQRVMTLLSSPQDTFRLTTRFLYTNTDKKL
jgi:hypothetical protein